jgi:hypothetical protein
VVLVLCTKKSITNSNQCYQHCSISFLGWQPNLMVLSFEWQLHREAVKWWGCFWGHCLEVRGLIIKLTTLSSTISNLKLLRKWWISVQKWTIWGIKNHNKQTNMFTKFSFNVVSMKNILKLFPNRGLTHWSHLLWFHYHYYNDPSILIIIDDS